MEAYGWVKGKEMAEGMGQVPGRDNWRWLEDGWMIGDSERIGARYS